MIATRNAIVVAVSALAILSGPVAAQGSLRAPAEVPPASYQGAQYVDSTGCVYVRAGASGNVTWVPRVTRDRKPICGYKPSVAAASRKGAAPQPTVIDLSRTPATTSGSAAAPAAAATTTLAQAETVDPNARILPPHLYKRREMVSSVRMPKGYEPVWSDDRLNPRRAEQSRAGQEQMSRYWTNTVPRRALTER